MIRKKNGLPSLTYPQKENSHLEEKKSFYALVQATLENNPNLDGLIKKHLEKYSWIGARGYNFIYAWDEKIIRDRITNFLSQKKDPYKELEHLNAIRQENTKATKELIKELKLNKIKGFVNFIALAQDFVYLRTWRTDLIYGAGYKALNLFVEISKRFGIDLQDISYFAYPELLESVKNEKVSISQETIKKRKRKYFTLFWQGDYQVVADSDIVDKTRKMVLQEDTSIKSIKGNIAFRGMVQGAAKLVLSVQDISKVKHGDILVAVMTFPHLIPAMEKAAAFVTDEGGILCHAAIIAREMRKPCVIATKFATQIIKDGDLIEVDANKGVVRVLKNKN